MMMLGDIPVTLGISNAIVYLFLALGAIGAVWTSYRAQKRMLTADAREAAEEAEKIASSARATYVEMLEGQIHILREEIEALKEKQEIQERKLRDIEASERICQQERQRLMTEIIELRARGSDR